jgi:hypothetical protein
MPATQPEDMPATFEQAFNTGAINQVLALYEQTRCSCLSQAR